MFCNEAVTKIKYSLVFLNAKISYQCDDTLLTTRLAAVLRVVGSIPAWNKYLYGLQIIVADLAVFVKKNYTNTYIHT